jgi:SAM-dependent methyltransferase
VLYCVAIVDWRASVRSLARRWLGKAVRWAYRSGHREALTRHLLPVVQAMTGTVVDIGGGRESPLAERARHDVTRIRVDISAEFAPDVQADGGRLPFADDSVDCVVMSEVLEHVPRPAEVIGEALRILKPGGALAGSVPFLALAYHADPHDYYRYTHQGIAYLLQDFGQVDVRPHGNALGVAWRMVFSKFRFLVVLNPLMRQLSRGTDPVHAEGHTFVARKPTAEAGQGR